MSEDKKLESYELNDADLENAAGGAKMENEVYECLRCQKVFSRNEAYRNSKECPKCHSPLVKNEIKLFC